MLESLFEHLIEISLSVSVVVLLLLLLSEILNKKYSAKWKYWIWLFLAIRLLVPFNVVLSNPPIRLAAPDAQKTWTAPASLQPIYTAAIEKKSLGLMDDALVSPAADADAAGSGMDGLSASGRFDFVKLIRMIWLAGLLFIIVCQIIIYGLFKKRIRPWCAAISRQDDLKILAAICREMNIRRKIPMMTCKLIKSPMVIGIFKQVLLLPEMTFTPRQMKMILHHELVHIRRRDILYKCLVFAAKAVHWFNPFVHLLEAEADKEVEMSCDSEVTMNQNGIFRKDYCEVILAVVQNGRNPGPVFSTDFGTGKAILRRRFECLLDMRDKKKGILLFVLIVLIVGFIGICISCNQMAATIANAPGADSNLVFTNRQMLSAGPLHVVGLRKNGTVVARFSIKDLDTGQFDISTWKDIVSVAAGGEAWAYSLLTIGLKKDGTVASTDKWGNMFDVSSWKDIIAVSAGDWHLAGLKKDGTAVATGVNEHHECDVSMWKDIIAISAGYMHTVGLKADGTVVAVGSNECHECDVSAWKDIIAVSAGLYYTIGLKKDGTLAAVGNNKYVANDVSSWTDIVAISAGPRYAVGLKNDGTVVSTTGGPDLSGWKDIRAITASIVTSGLKKDGTVVLSELPALQWKNIGLPQPD
jgi:beta-lactamase regulating signal transducer with metallopeptidase domain